MKLKEIKEINSLLPSPMQISAHILEEHVQNEHFTAWSLGNSEYFVSSYMADEAFSEPIAHLKPKKSLDGFHPYFDLASLTKPLFLNCLLRLKCKDDFHGLVPQSLNLFHWAQKHWNSDLLKFINKNPTLTLQMFLSHQSHFVPWIWCKYFISVHKTDSMKCDFVNLLLKNFASNNPPVYSDLNYMFLSLLVESIFDINDWPAQMMLLNKGLNSHFFHASLNPEKSVFAIPSYPYIVSPCEDTLSHEQVLPDPSGLITAPREDDIHFVHDINANLFASLPEKERIISGHSGLYGNIADVFLGARFLRQTQPFMHDEILRDGFVYGLDHKDKKFGHLGYTGTSFWFRLKKSRKNPQNEIILLTNRTSRRNSWIPQSSLGVPARAAKKQSSEVPRIYIVTNVKQMQHSYFFVYENKFESLSQEEFLKKSADHFYATQKIRDESKIFDYFNLNELRDTLEKQIW